jgi:hypothetical protein
MASVPDNGQADVVRLLDRLRHVDQRLADVPADIQALYQDDNPNWRAAGVSATESIDAAIRSLNETRAMIANKLSPFDQSDSKTRAAKWAPGNSGPGF